MDVYYVDGEFVPADQAVIPVDDLAVLRGYGVFDFLQAYGGRPFCLQEHVERLKRSAALIGLYFPWSHDEIENIVQQTLARNQYRNANIRIVVTGGSSPDFITPQKKPRLLVLLTALADLPAWWYSRGVKIITVPIERYIPEAKSINYIPAILALQKARRQDAVEAVYVDRKGRVLEGTTSNIFAFMGEKLVTPGAEILAGITRQVILDLAVDIFSSHVREVNVEELRGADEVFITASNKKVLPVVQVDANPIGNGKPGDRTRRVMEIFEKYLYREDWVG